jgi:hypothetical protein
MDANDGSLIFDTELDESGFEKGSNKLYAAIKELTEAVTIMSDNMMSSFNKVIPLLQSVASSASAVSERLTGTATQTADANERVIDTEQRVGDTVNRTSDAVNQQTAAVTNYGNTVRSTQGSISALEREIGSLSTGLQSISQSAETGFANGRAVLAFDSKLQALEQRLSEAHTRLTEFGDTNIPTEAFTTLTSQISRAEQALFRLYDRRDAMEDMGVDENSKQWQRLALQIENAEYLLTQYERERDTLAANGGAFIKGSDTDEFARMQASLNDAGEVLLRNKGLIDQESLAQARLNVLTAQEAVAAATTTRQREAAIERLREAQAELNELANSMSNNTGGEANNAPTEETVSRWSRFGAALRTAGAAALKVSGTLALMPFKAAAKGFQKLASGIKNYISNAKKAHKESNFLVKSLTSLKRMLITRIKRMFISAVFNEVKEALKSLAKFSDGFNDAMSNIKNSSKQFSGNLAVSLGGVVQAIEPMITGLLDRLSTAFTYINALFAVLGGKSTMTVAKKQTDSYRDSLDGASKAAENLKNQTYGFDELNKRSSDDKSGADNGSDRYEEVPIDSVLPDKLKSLFDELKNLWDNGEYFNFGKKFAELLNGGMQTIDDWINGTLRPKGTEWAKNFAEILNGLVDGFDWGLLGKTVADGLNAVADICNTFFTTFDFVELGSGIGTAVNGWFSNIDWTLHAQTIANGLNSIAGIIYGFVSTLDWAQVGDSIAAFVQSFFNSIDWTMAADIISTAINGIADTFLHFVNDVDWLKIGSDCLASVSKALTDIDWGSAFQAVIDGFNALEELILGAIQGIDWQGIATELGNGINSIDIQELLTNAGKIVSDFISGVFTFATEFIETVDWFALTQKLWDGFFGMLANVDWGGLISQAFELLGAAIASSGAILFTLGENIWSALKSAWESVKTYFSEYIDSFGGDIVAGLWEGIKNAFVGVGEWIKENIFDPFINGFKKVFGIASPSTVMEEQGNFITEGFLNGITNAWGAITDFFSNAWDNIKTTASKAWESIKSTASTAWENIKSSAIGKKVSDIVSKIKDMGSNIKNSLSTLWDNVKTKTSTAWSNVKSTISEKITDAKNTLSDIGEKIKTNLSNTWTSVKEKASTLWSGIKKTVSDTYTNLKTSLSKTSDNIKSSIQKTWTNVKTEASTSWKNIKSTVTTLWTNLKTDLGKTDWKSVGGNLVNGLKSGISNAWNSLKSTVSNLASKLTDTLKSLFGIHSPSTVWEKIGVLLDKGLQVGVKREEGTVLSTVSRLAKDVNKELSGQKATLRIGAESDALLSRLNGIAERLANIVTAFQGINSALNRMGGFSIPVIASGSEVPYKTRISADAVDKLVLDIPSDLDERLSDHTYLLRQILALLERAKMGTNNAELAQEIAYALRGVNRGFGGV